MQFKESKTITFLTILILSVLSAGCSTFLMRVEDGGNKKETVYPATRFNYEFFECGIFGNCSGIVNGGSFTLTTLNLIDMPFSIASDTIFLPFDAISMLSTENVEKKNNNDSTQN